MIIYTKPYHFNFDIIGYQFPYNPNGFKSDNNWLITRFRLVDPKTKKSILLYEDANIETFDIQILISHLEKGVPFIQYTSEQTYRFEVQKNIKGVLILIIELYQYGFENRYITIELEPTALRKLLENLNHLVEKFPTR